MILFKLFSISNTSVFFSGKDGLERLGKIGYRKKIQDTKLYHYLQMGGFYYFCLSTWNPPILKKMLWSILFVFSVYP